MNVERILYWIYLVAQVILDVLGADEEPGEGEESLDLPPGMKPERIQVFLRICARAILAAFAEVGWTPGGEELAPEMKPERIQFWLRLIARFVLEVIAGVNGETGKSGGNDW